MVTLDRLRQLANAEAQILATRLGMTTLSRLVQFSKQLLGMSTMELEMDTLRSPVQ